jgi:hypothetical protein
VGHQSPASVVTGNQNSFYGAYSGALVTSGSNNVAIGAYTVNANNSTLTGSDNTYVGHSSGLLLNASTVAAARNTVIGAQALFHKSGANDNVYIGYRAARGDTMQGANNIGIGSAVLMPSKSAANQISFWVGATGGTGGYNALTRFTGGQWLVNNTTSAVTSATPSAALEINGTSGGFLPPRMTGVQRTAISSPAQGLYVWDSDSSRAMLYGTAWKGVAYTDEVKLGYLNIRQTTADATLQATDNVIECTTANQTITLPSAVGLQGKTYNIKVTGAITVTLATTSGQTIDGNASGTLFLYQWDNLTVISNNSNWIIL